MSGYFDPPANQWLIDRAALVIALADGRESASRADYRHERFKEIMAVLEEIAAGKPVGEPKR